MTMIILSLIIGGFSFIGILLLLKISSKQKGIDRILKRKADNKQAYDNNEHQEEMSTPLGKTSFLSTVASNIYFNRYLTYIDFEKNRLINMSSLRLLAVRAGIRSNQEHKVIAVFIFILPVFGFILGVCGMMLYDPNSTLTLQIVAGCGTAFIAFKYPAIRLNSIGKDRLLAFETGFPDLLDLMMVCIEAGVAIEQVFIKMGEEFEASAPIIAEEVRILSAELTYFLDSSVAYDNFIRRLPHPYVRAFCSALVQSRKYGTPLVQSLRSLSKEVRESQIAEIERKAASLPAKLTVPMLLFTLPVLMVVILAPAALQLMRI